MNIRIAGTVNDSIVDGPGLRYTIFVQGCPHNCPGCHNPQTHDFNSGTLADINDVCRWAISNPLLSGVTFSGGEPLCQAEGLYRLGLMIKEKTDYDIITFTGYTFEYLLKNADKDNFYMELLSITDYLIDGRFEEDKKSYLLQFRGSSNQRILDCRQSLSKKKAVEIEFK